MKCKSYVNENINIKLLKIIKKEKWKFNLREEKTQESENNQIHIKMGWKNL